MLGGPSSVPAADQVSEVNLARPTPQQYAWHEQERIQFVCLDPCTWQGREYDDHSTLINQVVIMEDYREGERIREYVVEGLREGEWRELKSGTSVGRKKIDLFRPTPVSHVRLRVTKCAAEPLIRSFAAFYVEGLSAGSPPATQTCSCDKGPSTFYGATS